MRYFLWIVGITLLSLSSRAEPIVEMGSSARAYGMGGALTALADDESAVFYNPAGLASLSRLTISAFYQRAFDVVHHIALTGAARSWGAQLIYIDTGPIESTNEFGNPSGELTQYAATAILVGTAFSLGNLSLGVRGKLFGDPQQTHWGIDLGALVHLGILRAGIVTENLLGSRAISWRVAIASVFAINPRLAVTPALESLGSSESPRGARGAGDLNKRGTDPPGLRWHSPEHRSGSSLEGCSARLGLSDASAAACLYNSHRRISVLEKEDVWGIA
jgi:hypothetical protein